MSLPSEKTIDSGSDDETIITTQQLKMQFHSTRKGDLETIESYVNNLKSIADSLAANDNPLSYPDLVLQLLAGLPSPQYLPYQNRISSQFPLPDFSTACSLLYMYESLLQEQQKANSTNNDSPDSEEGNFNSNNNTSNKEIFDKILGVFDTVSNVVTTAWGVYSMFGTSSMANTMGNKKYTRRNRNFSTACSLLYMYESLLQEQQKANGTSNKEIFDKILGVFDTVSTVVKTARGVYSMFGTSSTANTMGNKKYTRRNRRRGRK